jgi:hypothetical protein
MTIAPAEPDVLAPADAEVLVPLKPATAPIDELRAESTFEPEPFTDQHVLPIAWPALPPKSLRAAYLWLAATGLVGGHRFYLGSAATGGLYACTAGVLGLGVLVDAVALPWQVRRVNALRAMGIQ